MIAAGGTSLYIETVGISALDKDGKSAGGGGFKITGMFHRNFPDRFTFYVRIGHLGDVMKESATISYINAKRILEKIDPSNKYFTSTDINLHVPEGATPKVYYQSLIINESELMIPIRTDHLLVLP